LRARASRARLLADAFPSYNGPATGRASAAVAEAYNKLGSPYEWGAEGPSRFDCSGLTMWAWARGGVSLPHSSQAQYDTLPHVAQSDIQPGDLTFYGSPIHHVGIYIGGGQMINAPHTGDVVRIADAFRSDYVGAARP
jgi:cell wall-associated NlpC family hydrolase